MRSAAMGRESGRRGSLSWPGLLGLGVPAVHHLGEEADQARRTHWDQGSLPSQLGYKTHNWVGRSSTGKI